jgi:hypothetical protein
MTFEIRQYAVGDPEVEPLLAELAVEYEARYGSRSATELTRYPPEEFGPPGGVLLIVREHGESVAGGAFKRYDEQTAEVKRMWTHSAHRRRRCTWRPATAAWTPAPSTPRASDCWLSTKSCSQGQKPRPKEPSD